MATMTASATIAPNMPVQTRPTPEIEAGVWQGVAICQRRIPVLKLETPSLDRSTWPVVWVDTNYQNFGNFGLSKPPTEDLLAWAEMSRLRLDALFEQRDESLKDELSFTSHDSRFTTTVNPIPAPPGMFRARNIRLFSVRIKDNGR